MSTINNGVSQDLQNPPLLRSHLTYLTTLNCMDMTLEIYYQCMSCIFFKCKQKFHKKTPNHSNLRIALRRLKKTMQIIDYPRTKKFHELAENLNHFQTFKFKMH